MVKDKFWNVYIKFVIGFPQWSAFCNLAISVKLGLVKLAVLPITVFMVLRYVHQGCS
jgi:hypothetical protein